ncbi:Glycosyl hydrolases family 38 C-terminal domain-containing protein [Actinacidiphila yanglinensis]|uniref:Glycosyl hydrolases family 38 C-terminal domain-containing protein n=1 Tax=Actinacidiphila yanglinensis TaxID=310779 RepID=A0A1H6E2E4_9ACTN|nr:glycoside hydrolase family 38 C-terminal domain-containing protein [Actinacidiphila yanglinensis]SEG91737.1 Glycosyl hydrolases family 38 C-terminal domain-containing protein [Actinacidiphila yanglinensis]
MTTRALVRDRRWSTDKARHSMVGLAVAATAQAGGTSLRAMPEHLVRRTPDGALRCVRILIGGDPAGHAGWTFTAEAAGHGPIPVQAVPAPGGQRLLLPLEDGPRDVRITATGHGATAVLAFRLEPPREWTIHLVHHSHLDIGYTDPQGTVLGEHVAFLDSCLDLTRATDGWDDHAKFRWAVESLWSFEQWAAARPPQRVAEFIARVKAGQIELTAMPYNLHTDTCSTDELHELLRLARSVKQAHGVEFRSAMQTDVPGTVAGLPDALAPLGVRYLSVAHNWAGRSVPNMNGGAQLPRLFRWRAPSGNELLTWMTDSPHGLAYMEGPVLGFDTSYEMVDDLLPAYLTALATNPYPIPPELFGSPGPTAGHRDPYPWDLLHLRVQGHFGDNAPPRLILAETVRRWNETWAAPTLRLSTNTDFFTDAEQRLGDAVPVFEGDWGDWWVEGVGSGARPQAMVRRAQSTVTDASTLYGMAALSDPAGPAPAHAEDARRGAAGVYRSISLFNEHTWGAGDPWTHGDTGMHSGDQQWHWKYGYALHGDNDADTFLDHASSALGAVLPAAAGACATFWAVNTTSAPRTSVVALFLRESRVPLDRGVSVADGRTGKHLPVVEEPQTNPVHRDAGRWLHVEVPDVPPLGLVRLDLTTTEQGPARRLRANADDDRDRGGDGRGPDVPPPSAENLVLENDHLRVRVDLARCCVAEITEKATGRELVDTEAVVGFNGYVYDTYTTAPGYNHQANKTTSSDELELLGSRSLARPGVLLERVDDAVGRRLTYEYAADGVRRARTTISLGRDDAHVVIDNRFDKPATMTKESAYLAFPFALSDPSVHYEITGAMTGTGLAHVPGAPQHMRAVRSFVALEDSGGPVAWVTRDAPLVEPETIPLPYAPFPDSTAPRQPGTVYSWVHNNLWDTNFPSQQGFDTTFRYAVGVRRRGETDISAQALALRTAQEVDHPLVGVAAHGEPVAGDAAERALLRLDDPSVRVIDAAPVPGPAGDGGTGGAAPTDILVRLQSFATEPRTVRLTCGFPVTHAERATFLGDPAGPVTRDGDDILVEIPRLGSSAVRLRPGTPAR